MDINIIQQSIQEKMININNIKIFSENAINQHEISNMDIATQNDYLLLLISVLIVSSKDNKNGWEFIETVFRYSKLKQDMPELLLKASTASEQQLEERIFSINNSSIGDIFALDCMLLYIIAGADDTNMLNYISILFIMTQLTEAQVNAIAILSKIIAEQDELEYTKLRSESDSLNFDKFNNYITFWKNNILNTCKNAIMFFGDSEDIAQKFEQSDIPDDIVEVYFFNRTFSDTLCFEGFNKLKFDGCNFVDIKKIASMEDVNEIFTQNAALKFEKNKLLIFENCCFEKIYSYNKPAIFFSDNINVQVIKCSFKQIKTERSDSVFSTGIAAIQVGNDKSLLIKDCSFADVEFFAKRNPVLGMGGSAFMFENTQVNATNCTAKNCCNIAECIPNIKIF